MATRKPILVCCIAGILLGTVNNSAGMPERAASILVKASVSDEDRILDAVFRIDIQTIQMTLTYDPVLKSVDGDCHLIFRMRPGQKRPLFHFDPLSRGEIRNVILRLDGEEWLILSIDQQSILKIVRIPGSTQDGLEIQRSLDDGRDHSLELVYRLTLPAAYPRFTTNVDDLQGDGNEEIFPTINSPAELARHQITLRVTGPGTYRCIGSGLVLKTGGPGLQEWVLDTEREVASYTVMFALLPQADTVYEERVINGLPVRIMAFDGGASIGEAFTILKSWLPELEAKFGPYPMPRGLSIFLVTGGGGMEYFGGTISSLSALRHEVCHHYFGCSTVAKTYRDSWWDEAAASWVADRPDIEPIANSYRSNIANGRAPYAVGFDSRAYADGARILSALARRIGGRENMILFLRDLCLRHSFAPFSSLDFADYFLDYSGVDVRQDFINWLYRGQAPGWAAGGAAKTKAVDWTPPEPILVKYGLMIRQATGERRSGS